MMAVRLLLLTLFLPYCACVLLNIRPFQRAIMQAHNYYRRQEPAANMQLLRWDPYLARRAAQWSENCHFEHQRQGLGENLAYFTSTGQPVPARTVIQRSIGLWASERRLWRWSRTCGAACHYTQLVWAHTSNVGCAVSYCPVIRVGYGSTQRNAMYFACFYSPAGNFIGNYPYIPGPRCSRCGRGQSCSYGLCSGGSAFGRPRRSSPRVTPIDEFLGLLGAEKAEPP